MELVDFSACPTTPKAYSGANGSKISVIYDGDVYMLKFHGLAKNNPNMTYSNSVISEYVGSKVFAQLGIEAQEVVLGLYRIDGTGPVPVVACKDFAVDGFVLQDFAAIKNTVVATTRSGYGIEFSEVLDAIRTQSVLDPKILEERFWEMFVVDALLGNWDRHNGNWGMLYNQQTGEVRPAPVFDCGSCLFPQADPVIMQRTIEEQDQSDLRTYDLPPSAFKVNGVKQTYHQIMAPLSEEGFFDALLKVVPRISIEEMDAIMDPVPDTLMDPLHKAFTKSVIRSRFENLLIPAYDRAIASRSSERKQEHPISLRNAAKEAQEASDALRRGCHAPHPRSREGRS